MFPAGKPLKQKGFSKQMTLLGDLVEEGIYH